MSVNVSAFVSNNLELLPKDMVIVIANLFENAINAVAKLKNSYKIINMSIMQTPKHRSTGYIFRVKDPFNSVMSLSFAKAL